MHYHVSSSEVTIAFAGVNTGWAICQSVLARRESRKSRQAEEIAKTALNEQTKAEGERDELRARQESLWRDNDNLRDGLRTEITRLREELDALREQYHEADCDRKSLKTAVDALADTVRAQKLTLESEHKAREENPHLRGEITRLTKRVKELEADVKRLQTQLARYEQQNEH